MLFRRHEVGVVWQLGGRPAFHPAAWSCKLLTRCYGGFRHTARNKTPVRVAHRGRKDSCAKRGSRRLSPILWLRTLLRAGPSASPSKGTSPRPRPYRPSPPVRDRSEANVPSQSAQMPWPRLEARPRGSETLGSVVVMCFSHFACQKGPIEPHLASGSVAQYLPGFQGWIAHRRRRDNSTRNERRTCARYLGIICMTTCGPTETHMQGRSRKDRLADLRPLKDAPTQASNPTQAWCTSVPSF
ncbi:hypothetical protein DAEQUDRAFT_227495 [Daedalea quercina L-15889]|uniref:Uncharacterized protein n=1 Tax=Daedalea quercina L-15889 TaxID=1314783 RepID=A0A165R1R8_9APHY|nr:hypothetical protein DAEQUDRAFT_227495 [Daedalea quercina L-15889]